MRIQSICAALALAVLGAGAHAQTHYVAIPLQVPAQFTYGCGSSALNNIGTSVGVCSLAGQAVAVQWDSHGNLTQLPAPTGAGSTRAAGINSTGQINGSYYDSSNTSHAVRWDNGSIVVLDGTASVQSYGYGINNAGDVVGVLNNVATVWEHGGKVVSLVAPTDGRSPADTSVGFAINERGEVAGGASYLGGQVTAPVLWRRRQSVLLDELFFLYNPAVALNAEGVAVGYTSTMSGFTTSADAAEWTGLETMTLPPLQGANYTTANGINRSGVVVGSSGASDGQKPLASAARWIQGQVTDLGAITTWPIATVVSSQAIAINDRGWIAASYLTSDSKGGPVILKPSQP